MSRPLGCRDPGEQGGGGEGGAGHDGDYQCLLEDNSPCSPIPMSGALSVSPASSRAPLLPPSEGEQPPPRLTHTVDKPKPNTRRKRRLWRSYSCHQFDARGAFLQWGLGLGACFPMDVGRPLLRFTDEEVFLANHPGADYVSSNFNKRQ